MKLDFDKVMKLFPAAKPRDAQVEVIQRAVKAYNQGAKYVVADAPVGVGKSLIGMTLARAFGSSYMLTLTEQLQEQYLRDFSSLGLKVLKGRSKYQCSKVPALTCNEGKHEFTGSKACEKTCGCTYKLAREAAFAAPHCVANYHSFVWNVGKVKKSKQSDDGYLSDSGDESSPVRPLIVCDEVHRVEDTLLGLVSVEIDLKKLSLKLPAIPDSTDPAQYWSYIKEEVMPALLKASKAAVDPKSVEDIERLYRKCSISLSKKDTEEWIPERESMKVDGSYVNDPSKFVLKPLTVASYGKLIHGYGERQLLMSGTVLSAYHLVTSLGLDPSEGDHIELDSPFPAENRPIYVGDLNMTKQARDESWPVMASMVDRLFTAHGQVKGILLCPSNEMLKYIHQRLSPINKSRVIFAYGDERVQRYQQHMVSRNPTVLCASGYWEGADLVGDASRFQIIPSVPRPMWQGQIAARSKRDPGWYRWLSYCKLLQGTGRSVRSETDSAVTYVLDQAFRDELTRKDSMIPKWVAKAVHLVDRKKRCIKWRRQKSCSRKQH